MARFALLLLLTGGCRTPAPEPPASTAWEPFPAACRVLKVEDPASTLLDSLSWDGSPGPEADAWCRGVGPALLYRPRAVDTPVAVTELAIVSWNVHLAAGHIDALIRDLRQGRLDGRPTDDFVLLLQEVIRVGPDVPSDPGPGIRSGRRMVAVSSDRAERSIELLARRHGLHLLYVPSARNGRRPSPGEDRGNAILSTVPLREPGALGLPVQRQRRVAVSARIGLEGEQGGLMELWLINLHLDLRSRWSELHRSIGGVRADQARLVVESYGGEEPAVVGGDLNTWFGGPGEEAVRILREEFPLPRKRPRPPTLALPGPLPDLRLDHVFFRLPEGLRVVSRVIEDPYGSDHRPVLARIVSAGPDQGGNAPSGTGRRESP